MIIKDFSFAFRNIRRNKSVAFINVFGLSIGISACLLIFLIATYELSFDRFHSDGARIYRVYSKFPTGNFSLNPGVSTALPVAVQDNFTGIESLTNFHTLSLNVKVPDGKSRTTDFGVHDKVIIAGPEYFDVFNYYRWVAGDPQSLAQPFRVVLTESKARLYFGNIDFVGMIGRQVLYQDSLSVSVSGIVKDIEDRTDFDFTDFISFNTVGKSWLDGNKLQLNTWNAVNSSSQFFIKLSEGTAPEKIREQFLKLPQFYRDGNRKWDDWRPVGHMQALADLHFNADLGIFDSSRSVMDKSTLYILIAIAGVLLFIAVINFINLETAQASGKAKEVGVRKALGGSRRSLMMRFLSESTIICVLAVAVSVLWVRMGFTYFSDYIPEGMLFDLSHPTVIAFLLSCIVIVSFLAGLYPAFVLSGYKPALALKNLTRSHAAANQSVSIRKWLTVCQFLLSQIFLAGVLIIYLQLDYMVNKDLGFSPESVVFVSTPENGTKEQRARFRIALASIPEIEAFGMHGSGPVSNVSFSQDMTFEDGKDKLTHRVYMKEGDTSYLRVYRLELLAGRNFVPADSIGQLIVNETYLHLLGFTNPRDAIGRFIGPQYSIVGVVSDFHTSSLHQAIAPIGICYQSDETGFGIRLHAKNHNVSDLNPGLSKIEAVWKAIYPDETFHLSFMSDTIKRYYENERRTGKLAGMATTVAIFISCLGLFALSSFTVAQRTKEIGIRKILGASVNSILVMLASESLILVALAFLVATPIAYYLGEGWLQEFAYRIPLSPWVFALSGVLSTMTALVTISFRTVTAAKADPVKSLRYE